MDNQNNQVNPINPTPVFTNPQISVKKKPPVLAIIIFVVVIVIVIFIFKNRQDKNTQSVNSITPTQEAISPTIVPEVDKQTVKIQVLNGTGTPGQATAVVAELKTAGFNGDNIKTDNASKFDQSSTTIATKAGFSTIADDIKAALNSTFSSIDINPTELGSDSAYDVVITTGGKLYETPTPKITEKVNPTGGPTSTPSPTTNPTNTPMPTVTPTPTP